MKQRLELTQLLYKTITNIDAWKHVLEHLCKITGTPKGIIMLRDWESAELFIPKNLHVELQSPMIYGLSNKEIEAYITEFYQFDPWTEVEKNHHPISPYAMSEHLKIQKLKETKFWQWLEPQKISDSVVVDIHNSKTHWVSINLFFDGSDEKVKESSLNVLEKYQKNFDEIWSLGLQFRASNSTSENLIYFLEQQITPSVLINNNLIIIHKNKKAEELFLNIKHPLKIESDQLLIRNKENYHNFKKAISSLSDTPFDPICPPQTEVLLDDWLYNITLLSEAQNIVGEDTALRLITISSTSINLNQQLFPIWETPTLTPREKELVEVLALGGRVVDFQNKYEVAKSTAHNHWTSAKQKLQVTDRAEIFAKHQVFSENQ
ncbi:helix-turn-helix transcriptional regulator [Marinomonas sp.]|uniref:helix-turn-helix transcriptional regulator n=1 Tax=Marinomonas sp. TaxID=1904862 RepID=UPI003BA84AFB